MAGLERGLTVTDMKRMQLGQLVDFVIGYNNRSERAKKERKKIEKGQAKRKATQADIKAFVG